MKYSAFISYRHSENGRRHAVALETALKRYAKPTLTRPMRIFRDEKHMKPDISLPRLIKGGLEQSEFMIFLAEKDSAASPWCREELEYWCNPLQLNRKEKLILVLIDDEIVVNGIQCIDFNRTTALPPILKPYLDSIPLYVDLRWAKSNTDTDLQNARYRHEINSLSAKLRDMAPEDLNDEEIRVFRRNIQLRNGVIAALILLSVLAGRQTLIANRQAAIANEQTKIAREQSDIAKAERDKASAALDSMKIAQSQYFQGQADAFMGYEEYQTALSYYFQANRLTPDNSDLKTKIKACSLKLKKQIK